MTSDRSGILGLAPVNIGLVVGGAITVWANLSVAQITPDATLGTESSVVTPNVNIRGLLADQINGGAIRGANLFHSFQEFNVGDGQRVYFANPTGIENILSRITGNNLSNILGTLGVDGGASLFLLNPNGIIFGAGAQLDISGSFFASTANSVVFDNGYQFSATNPEAPPLLTVSVPLGVQYGANQPRATIANTGTLAIGQNFTLSAGNLDLQGQIQAGNDLTLEAQDTVKARDSVTNPFIAVAGGKFLVQGSGSVDIFSLNHANSGFFSGGDMVLKSPNAVMGDAHYTTGGNFRIEQLDGSLGDLDSPGDPVIRASGNVSFDSYQGASLHIFAGGSVNLGTVTITGTDATNFINETVPLSQTLPDGTNTVTINGSTRPTLDIRAGTLAVGTPLGVTGIPTPTGIVFSDPPTSADIVIGTVTITQPNGLVFITNNYHANTALTGNIQVSTIGIGENDGNFTGNGGNIFIDSRGNITIPDAGIIRTTSTNNPSGRINLVANGSLLMTGGAQLDASTSGQGNAGDININVGNDVTLTGGGTRIQSFVRQGANANSGAINLKARSLSLTNGGGILNTVIGAGNGKDITINVLDAVTIDGAGAGSNSVIGTVGDINGVGKSGNIYINAGELILTNGGAISSHINPTFFNAGFLNRSTGKETAGDININVRNAITIDGGSPQSVTGGGLEIYVTSTTSGIYSFVSSGGNTGGNINLTAGTLSITDGGTIYSDTYGGGKAGNITLNVRDRINVAGVNSTYQSPSSVSAATYGGTNAPAGQITVNTGRLRVANGAYLNASTYSSANGGEITVNANTVELTGGGQILALPYDQGHGGNVKLNVSDKLTISGNDPIFESRFREFGPDVVTNQGGASGVFTGYGLGAFAALLNIPIESTGNAGNISIIGPRELNIDGGQLFTAGFNSGNGGNLSITQTGAVNLTNVGLMVTSTFGTGNAGTLFVDTSRLNLQNQSLIVSSTAGAGDAGALTIRASDSVEVLSGSRIVSETVGSGRGGDLTVDTRRLITRNGEISASTGTKPTIDGDTLIFTPSSGSSGNLTVRASESVDIGGEAGTPIGGLFTSTFGYGQGGDLSVETGRLTVQNGGRIEAGTIGLGQGGTVRGNALESIELIGTSADGTRPSGISAYSRPPLDVDANLWQGSANSGGVNLTTNQLIIRDGAEVTTAVEGTSQTGNAGNVELQANSLYLTNGGRITSRSDGVSNAGNIKLSVSANLLSSGGTISATSTQLGGGDITIAADDIRLRNSSLISTSVKESTGGGGNITIDSTVFFAVEDSDILANADAGPGGDIKINSDAFLAAIFARGLAIPVGRNPGDFARFRGNGRVDISVDSRTGTPGIRDIPNVGPEGRTSSLPSDLADAEGLIDRRCTPADTKRGSSFTITGRGGLPPSPNDPLMYYEDLTNWVTIEEREENGNSAATDTNPTSSHPQQLVEAQGWIINEKGQVVLTASAPTATPSRPRLELPPCEDNKTATDSIDGT